MLVARRPSTAMYLSYTGGAVGAESMNVARKFGEVISSFLLSEHMGGALSQAHAELGELLTECSAPDWDGYGAAPANVDSFFQARKFLEFLPNTLPNPELSVDPDGEFGLDWMMDSDRVLSISLGPTGRISYAATIGASKLAGVDYLLDDIPTTVLQAIRLVVD